MAAALVTEEEVRSYLGIEEGDEPSTEWIALVIEGVSGTIANTTGRDYSGGDVAEVAGIRVFQRYGDDSTIVIDDCREISQVDVGTDGNWSELPFTAWSAQPTNNDLKTSIRFSDPSSLPASGVGWFFGGHAAGVTPWPKQSAAEVQGVTFVQVTAKWGTGSVPAHIKLAALLWISSIRQRDNAYFSENFAKGVAVMLDIPPDVLRIISGDSGAGSSGVGAV